MDVHVRVQLNGTGALCRTVLETLPAWFGIPSAVDDYCTAADTSPTVVASVESMDVGLLVIRLHTSFAAEVLVMAVRPEHHRRGIGRIMVQSAEKALTDRGVEFLQVKTLSSARRHEGYDITRAFYLANGFRPLEEFPNLWGPENPALQMVKAIGGT